MFDQTHYFYLIHDLNIFLQDRDNIAFRMIFLVRINLFLDLYDLSALLQEFL